MQMDLKNLFDGGEEAVSFSHSLDLSAVEQGSGRPFIHPVELSGLVENTAGVVLLRYSARTVLQFCCDRCLEPVEYPINYRFEHVLVREAEDEADNDFILVPDAVLDLDELAVADIILELPSKILCAPDCKGLCPRCGQNLNQTTCGCPENDPDPRLAALRALLEQ